MFIDITIHNELFFELFLFDLSTFTCLQSELKFMILNNKNIKKIPKKVAIDILSMPSWLYRFYLIKSFFV